MALPSEQLCHRYPISDIVSATENFSTGLIIGQGGFGKVYKGVMKSENGSNNIVVAIKRLDAMSKQGASEFRAELDMLSRLRHSHLVSLLGYCVDDNEMIIIYEFMPQGTLDHHLHKSKSDHTPLSWKQRLMISVGAARGLDYLHTGAGTKHGVIHGDMKSSNILLDVDLEPRISDFGLAKVCPTNQSCTHINTSVKGTHGYLDPKFQTTGKLNRRTDIFAFGVILFELLSARRAVFADGDGHSTLATWAPKCVKKRNLDQLVASELKGKLSPKCLKVFAQIAYRCLHNDPDKRPMMSQVVVALQSSLALQEKFENDAKRAGLFGFTRKMPFGLPTKENSGNRDKRSSEKTKSNRDYNLVPTADDARYDAVHPDDEKIHSPHHTSSLKKPQNDSVYRLLPTDNGASYKVPHNTMIMRSHSSNIFSYDDSIYSPSNVRNTITRDGQPRVYQGLVFNKAYSSLEVSSSSSLPTNDDGVYCNEVLSDNEQVHSLPFKLFSYAELKWATRNFRSTKLSDEKRGRVYSGWVNKKTYFPSDEGVGFNILVLRFDCWGRGNLHVLSELDHPNLHRILGYCLKDETLYLVHELTGRRSLYDYLRHYGDLPFIKRVKIAVGVARALVFLHRKHLHVKGWIPDTHEISLDEDDNPKLLCFEVAEWFRGLPLQGPPECNGYGLGLLLMEILTGEHLYGERNVYSLKMEDIWDQISETSNKIIKEVDPQIGFEIPSLIGKCVRSKYTIEKALNDLEQIYSRLTEI